MVSPAGPQCTVLMTADEMELRSSRAGSVAGTAAGLALVVRTADVSFELLPDAPPPPGFRGETQDSSDMLEATVRCLGAWIAASCAASVQLSPSVEGSAMSWRRRELQWV